MSQSTSRLNGPAYTANTQSSCQRYRSTSQRRHFSISQTADISSGPMRTRTPNSRGYNAIAIPDASNCPRRSGPLPSSTFITETPAHAPSQSASSLHAPQPESPSTDAHDHAFLPLQRSFDAPVRFSPTSRTRNSRYPRRPPANTRTAKTNEYQIGDVANTNANMGLFCTL